MAVTKVNKQVAKLNEIADVTFTTATSAADGFALDFTGADEKEVAIFKGSGTVKLVHGNSIQGIGDTEEFTITGIGIVRLDSGRFKNAFGDNKDCVIAIPSATTITAACVTLGTEEKIVTSDATGK